ncbi:unnamed protein product [Brassica oleracea]|uniref:F-box domain-containing protein n=2 Tax=Brassica oleracea TaxID=3712 RepID=A0A0D3CQN8_BRAOL|nr:unnamed protein product [Brassica oleracea]
MTTKLIMLSDLPDELEAEILSRVPAKSLVKLKTTCKRCQKRTIKPRTRYQGQDTYALGYAVNNKSSSSCHSYKILRYCLNKNEQNNRVSTEFEFYELCSSSWRVFDYTNGDFGVHRGGISLKGDTYWVAGLSLMKFDFTTERFVRLPLPFQSSDLDDTVLSAVRDEKLSVGISHF